MKDLKGITEIRRGGGTEEQSHPAGKDPSTRIKNNPRQSPKNSSGVGDSGGASSSGQSGGIQKVDENREPRRQTTDGCFASCLPVVDRLSPSHRRKEGLELPQGDLRARFYEHYRKEAEEYDKEFMKKYDEDLTTTLIFAGLFSAVTSAFIIQVHSEFQQDPNEETAALLRVLIHKIDNTTFGGDVPTVPQWSGPTYTVVEVQAILLASLAASLFSAFLAMLGKQWLNRYASIDMRGSAIQRSQDRQRKLDGIVTWYFDHVMEALPLMLQAALLLLGCALSRYLWEINTAVALVVIGVTSFGVLFYLFIVVAGAFSVSCPYQTPGAQILRGIPDTLHHVLDIFRRLLDVPRWLAHIAGMLHSVFSASVKESIFCEVLADGWRAFTFLPLLVIALPLLIPFLTFGLIADAFQLGLAIVRGSAIFFRGVYSQLRQGLEHQTDILDMHCIMWTLRTSLDGPVRLSVLSHLATKATLAGFHSTLVVDCFDIFLGCAKVVDGHVAITQGLELLAKRSALCLLQTLSHLAVIDPTSRVLEDVRQRYTTAFPLWTDFDGLPFSHTLATIHCVFHQPRKMLIKDKRRGKPIEGVGLQFPWRSYKPSNNEYIVVACALAKFAQFEHQRRRPKKVPRWLLRFALHFLSQDLLPPTSVIANCLSIIAIDLDCTFQTPDESTRVEEVSHLITRKLTKMARADDHQLIHDKRKAISSLIPYLLRQDQVRQQEILGALSHVAVTSNFEQSMWRHIQPYITTLSNDPSPHFLNQIIALGSSYVSWHHGQHNETMVIRWAAAASTVPYTEVVGQSVVDALLQIASVDSLRPHIPVGVWAWLKKRPSLPPVCYGRSRGTTINVVRHVRALGDIEVLKSYLLLVWSEWDPISSRSGGLAEMEVAIREDFGGIGMGCHREDLIKHLDHVLGQLDQRLEYLKEHRAGLHERNVQWTKEKYWKLKGVLLDVDR